MLFRYIYYYLAIISLFIKYTSSYINHNFDFKTGFNTDVSSAFERLQSSQNFADKNYLNLTAEKFTINNFEETLIKPLIMYPTSSYTIPLNFKSLSKQFQTLRNKYDIKVKGGSIILPSKDISSKKISKNVKYGIGSRFYNKLNRRYIRNSADYNDADDDDEDDDDGDYDVTEAVTEDGSSGDYTESADFEVVTEDIGSGDSDYSYSGDGSGDSDEEIDIDEIVFDSEVIGAVKVKFGQLPYHVLIVRRTEDAYDHICSGSLVTPYIAITSAHTLRPLNFELYDFFVVAKIVYFDSISMKPKRKIKLVIPHPKYEEITFVNDIAVVIVEHAFKLGKQVNTISYSYNERDYIKENCVVSGWGASIPEKAYPNRLYAVNVNVISKNLCERTIGHSYTKNSVCSVGIEYDNELHGFCGSDSGGPLVCNGKYLIGVVSKNMSNACDKYAINMYADVEMNQQWISRLEKYYEKGMASQVMEGTTIKFNMSFYILNFFNILLINII